MTIAETHPSSPPLDPIPVTARHLREGDDGIRCAAARAIGAIGDAKAAPVLVDALLDEDADVRTDAMAALVSCARPEDAEAIGRSLMGDPVKEVKIFAIQALCKLKDRASIPLLRALAKDRCVDDIAWEDGAGMWDDWLDVQIVAITALGALGVREAVEDLLEARSDEMGQDVDHVVFAALANIPDGGIEALIGLLRDPVSRVRERAIGALSKARHDLLVPMKDLLIRDASPDVRRLAIGILDHDSPSVSELALDDPDATVRRAALSAYASRRRDIAVAALADPDETARAIALEGIMASPDPCHAGDLAANILAWMETGGARLAATCAAVLPGLSVVGSEEALCRLAANTGRPQEARIAAIASLGRSGSQRAVETLRKLVVDPAQQVKMSALAALAGLAKAGRESCHAAARNVLVSAIRGDFSTQAGPDSASESGQESFVEASKVEDTASSQIRINADGEIVSAEQVQERVADAGDPDSNVIAGRFPKSTLEAIQAPVTNLSEETGPPLSPEELAHLSETGKGRRRRVAVDGQGDMGLAVRLIALRTAADCPGDEIERSLVAVIGKANAAIRVAAFAAIALRSETIPLSVGLLAELRRALGDPDPLIRGHASQAVARCSPDAATQLSALVDDPDAIVRSHAVKAVAASDLGRAVAGFRDISALVRLSALEGVLAYGTVGDLEDGMRLSLDEGWTDCLVEAGKRSGEARDILVAALAEENLPRRQTCAALEAISASLPLAG